MGRMDEYDDEIKLLEKDRLEIHKVIFSFKSMTLIINRLVEETREIDDKYPKSELIKLWFCDMGMLFVLFLFSYSAVMVATIPFIFFYGYVLIQIRKAWKGFNYSVAQYRLFTWPALLVEIALAMLLQNLILG